MRGVALLAMLCGAAAPPTPYRVAVCASVRAGRAATARELAEALQRRGFMASILSASETVALGALAGTAWDCVVLADSPRFPAAAGAALAEFARQGGDLVLLGGHAFSQPTWLVGGAWLSVAEVEARIPVDQRPPGFDVRLRVPLENAFEEYDVYRLCGVVEVRPVPAAAALVPPVPRRGTFAGLSAVGFEFPDESSFVPLLSAHDRFGRHRGWAGGLLLHYAGPFRGSAWALFGIEEETFYRGPWFASVLAGVLDHFRRGAWEEAARRANQDAQARSLPLTAPPRPRLRLAGRHFVGADGKPVFLTGANMCGRGGFRDRWFGSWRPHALMEEFRRMRRAGLNLVRVYWEPGTPQEMAALRECARRCGVYLLKEIGFPKGASRQAVEERARQTAGALCNEPMLLGYDLANEPYPWTLAELLDSDGVPLFQKYPFPALGAYGDYARLDLNTHFSTFPRLSGKLPPPRDAVQRASFDSVNQVIATWISWMDQAIRQHDRVTPITVGYNTVYVAWPANARLDFVSNHVYENLHAPAGYQTIRNNVTTMDRLAALWPDKPILVGEFSFTGGSKAPDGKLLDVHNAGVAEALHYLYAFARGYAGVAKWMVCDWPVPILRRQATWIPREDEARQIVEARTGIYYYDGTPEGKPKPIAHALRFLRAYADAGNRGGSIEIRRSSSRIETGYVYRNRNALFVGDVAYRSSAVSFRCVGSGPANVMLAWSRDSLRAMATHDVLLTLVPRRLAPAIRGPVRLSGRHGGLRRQGATLQILLLEGEEIRLTTGGRVARRYGSP